MRLPKRPHRAVLEVLLYRRAREAHEDGVGQRPGHAPAENPVLGPVGLVHHDEHVLRGIQDVQPAPWSGQRLLELLDRRHDRPAHAGGEEPAQVAAGGGLLRRWEAAALEGARDLPVELPAVRHHDDGRVGQARLAAQLRRQPQHRQRLARPLRVPHDPAALLGLAANQHPLHRRAHGPVLLVARQLLHQPPPAPAHRPRSRAARPAALRATAARR